MPNIAAALKQEIARIARKELRLQIYSMKKATAQHRQHIAMLKRQVAALQSQLRTNGRPVREKPEPAARVRFTPKGIQSLRTRLGLSAAEFARLVGVSAQSVYNWERAVAKPRAGQLAVLAELRSAGRREAGKRLASLAG